MKRKGVPVDKNNIMVGSYAPKAEDHSFKTGLSFEFHKNPLPKSVTFILILNSNIISEAETAPSGMLARGTYKVKSKFIDDDKEEHASWEWNIEIAKSW